MSNKKVHNLVKNVLLENHSIKYKKDWNLLVEKLLASGGERVVDFYYEEDLDKILQRGQFFKGVKSKLVKMKTSRCHENSACFWHNYSDEHGYNSVKIVTGYALSDDGLWRQHSWVYLPKKKLIVETTEKRIQYFGFILNDEEANEFYFNNY